MNEAYVTGRSPERALAALREIIIYEETEPVIDMYERAAWMSGASKAKTQDVSRKARLDRDELRQLSSEIRATVATANADHVRLCAEVRVLGAHNRIMDESR